MNQSFIDQEWRQVQAALTHEETRERLLRKVVTSLSIALTVVMIGWGAYFWYLYKMYSFFRR